MSALHFLPYVIRWTKTTGDPLMENMDFESMQAALLPQTRRTAYQILSNLHPAFMEFDE